MPEKLIETKRVKSSELDLSFARELQGISLAAWTAGLDGIREPHEVRQAFDPTNIRLVAAALAQYKDFARHGHLVIASSDHFDTVDAFAMTRKDVSPKDSSPLSLAKRTGKRLLSASNDHFGKPQFTAEKPNPVYVWVKHAASRPEAAAGLGTAAILGSIMTYEPLLISTVYIDDENTKAIDFATTLGYSWDGNPENEKPVYRFGEHNEPTTQRRYTEYVGGVMHNSASLLDAMGAEVLLGSLRLHIDRQ